MRNAWTRHTLPHDRRPIPDWAFENVQLFPPLTKTGFFDCSGSCHFIACFADLQDDACRELNILAPVRSGKTLLADIWLPWVKCNDPGPFRWIFQDERAATDQAELRTWPTLMGVETIFDQLPENRFKTRTREIIFPDMPLHIGGPALGQLQSRGWRYMVVDEPWLYKEGRIEEIKGRLGDYVRQGIDKLLCISQGGTDGDEWDRQFQRGIIHEWEVPCLACGRYFAPLWTLRRADGALAGMRWDRHKTEQGMWDVSRAVPTLRYECPACAHPHLDTPRTKAEWNRLGRWTAEATEKPRTRRSRHWTAIIDYPWESLVDMYLQALNAMHQGVVEPLIAFFQKRMAEFKSEARLLEERSGFKSETYSITSDWPEEHIRFLTADRQAEDLYWVTARAWAKDGHSRRLWFGKLFGPAAIEAKRIELGIPPNRTAIDSGFLPKGDHGVYRDCLRYGWLPLKGVATEGGEPIVFKHKVRGGILERSYSEPVIVDPEIGLTGEGRTRVAMVRFSSPTYADRLSGLIERGLWLEPEADPGDPMDVEYRVQMSSEFKRPKRDKFTGKVRMLWVCPSRNNHARDCGKMQVLFATLADLLPDLEVTATESGR